MLRIRLADISDWEVIESLCENNLLGTKILCQINGYGFERDFLFLWLCFDSNENPLGIISKFEDNVTLIYPYDNGAEDIKAFLDMVGFVSLCCNAETAHNLGYDRVLTKKAYVYVGEYGGEAVSDLAEDYYREAYNLISENIPDSFSESEEAYFSFLSDFMFRRRRGLARIKGIICEKRVMSCALTSAETDKAAVISGVACEASGRKTGLGKKTVLSLAEELKSENKTAYVISLNEKAEGFYEHIGFELRERISFIERK